MTVGTGGAGLRTKVRAENALGGCMSFAGTVWARASPRHRLPAASPRIPACLGMLLFLLFAASATGQQALNDLGQASLEELGSIQVYTFFRFCRHR
jgi:hypothetical protein